MVAVPPTPGFRPLAIKITCGAEAAERANQAWTVAATAIASGAEVAVWLTGEAVWFAVVGRQPDLELEHATPVAELIEAVRSSGRIVVCTAPRFPAAGRQPYPWADRRQHSDGFVDRS